jgi:iron complex transport system substrate-binding protein
VVLFALSSGRALAEPLLRPRVLELIKARPSIEPSFLLGTEAKLAPVPQRIVTVAPSATELVFALGAGDRLIGVSRYDDYPESAKSLPKVGGFLDPSVEAIIALRPDLVVAVPNAGNRPPLERVARLGVPVLVVPGNSIADIFHATRALAPLLGKDAPSKAERLIVDLERGLAEVAKDAEKRPPPRVAFVYGEVPLVLAGPGSFADAMLRVLNAKNVIEEGPSYAQYSMEKLVLDAPEVIIDATEGHQAGDNRVWSRFASIPAVKNNRVYYVGLGDVLRPGPRIVEGMRRIAVLIRR